MRVMVLVKASERERGRACCRRPSSSPRWASSTRSWSRPASCWPATACSRARRASGCASAVRAAASTVMDGPFAETKELVAGYWIWQVSSMDEAVEWLKRAPFQDAEVEIRPFFEAEDFGDDLTPELRAAEEKLRAEAAAQALTRVTAWVVACRRDRRHWAVTSEHVSAVRSGDRGGLADRGRPPVGALTRLVHDLGTAEDLAQDALVAALRSGRSTGSPPTRAPG